MGYHPNGAPLPQFENPDRDEGSSYHPQRYVPQFHCNNSSTESHGRSAHAKNNMSSPLSSCDETKVVEAKKLEKKSTCKKKSNEDDSNKKPPRPYTEYNIFFQLERERILMELEKECRTKENVDIKEEEPVLNRPSDEHDVLPRPSRFAHLQLLPKWYDSTHRLAESKKNKEKRKHRKSHGLVGFLELTRRIAKEWSEAQEDVKLYCRQVAKRQLGYYKEELKVWKKNQELLLPLEEKVNENDANMSGKKIVSASTTSSATDDKNVPKLPVAETVKSHLQGFQMTMSPSQQPQYYPSRAHRNMPWQPRRQPIQGQSINRGYPAMPVLSPSLDFHDDYSYYHMPGSNIHPLDELMHRRKVYGSRSVVMQSTRPRKRMSDGVVSMENKEVASPAEGDMKEANSFLSPEDTGSPNNDIKTAITPSPSSRTPALQDHLPMKKRKMSSAGDDFGFSDVSPGSFGFTPGSGVAPTDAKLSPFNFSPSDGMLMTPNGEAIMGQFMGGGMSPWANESSLPYIECFSPQEGAAQSGVHQSTVVSMNPTSSYVPHGSQHYAGNAPM